MRTKTVCTALALLSLCAGYANARAPTPNDSDAPSVKVSFRDLNISTTEGARVLLARIHQAAKTVCGPQPYDPLWRRYEYDPCVNRAVDHAVARLDNPVVTALNGYKSSNGQVALASR